MILVRDVFQVKFGKVRDAINHLQKGGVRGKKFAPGKSLRLLTDLTGPNFYTLVVEFTFDSLADLEKELKAIMQDKDWKKWYSKLVPFLDSGHREILNIVE